MFLFQIQLNGCVAKFRNVTKDIALYKLYCDLRGRIKGAAHTLISRIVDAFNMTNIERSIKELLN